MNQNRVDQGYAGQNGSNMRSRKEAMLAQIGKINEVPGFDPSPFVVDYTDLNTGEVHGRLPVMIQMAWFRMKYPEGRISVQVSAAKDCFVALARVYPHYKDPADCYLAEATASRGACEEKPSVSPREWAQTAAVGIALRNAGFGLQFAMAGEDFGTIAPDELGLTGTLMEAEAGSGPAKMPILGGLSTPSVLAGPAGPGARGGMSAAVRADEYAVVKRPVRELTEEEKLQKALETPCPITKFSGKSLGEVLRLDPGAIKWVATKFSGEEEIKEAARRICEYALENATA